MATERLEGKADPQRLNARDDARYAGDSRMGAPGAGADGNARNAVHANGPPGRPFPEPRRRARPGTTPSRSPQKAPAETPSRRRNERAHARGGRTRARPRPSSTCSPWTTCPRRGAPSGRPRSGHDARENYRRAVADVKRERPGLGTPRPLAARRRAN